MGIKKIIFLVFILLPTLSWGAESSVSTSDMKSFYDMLKELQWDSSSDSKRQEIFQRVESAVGKLDENTDSLKQNYEDAKANEQSTANKTLTALTTAATGIGGMELAMGLSEKKADKEADENMDAYIETMRCTYGEGKQVKAGIEEIELPGGNDPELMKLRTEYVTLATSLKERKEALGMKPGIEAEEILDKATMGLYDDENVGITGGAYASLYRAKFLESEKDQEKIDAEQKATKNRVIAGGVLAGVGVVGGIVGNLIINGKAAKNKSAELRDEREKIVSDLQDIMQEVVDDCNANIREMKKNILPESEYVPTEIDDKPGLTYAEYSKEINDMQEISDIKEIEKMKDIPVCK